MALLQINEPGLASSLHQRKRLAAGIDLGTTHSLIAITRAGTVEILADNEGRCLLPSVVHYCQQGTDVGWNARSQAWKDPTNTVSSVKRLMGRSLADIKQRYPGLPYQFEASENGLPMIQTVTGLINPIQVSADILRALSARAVAVLKAELDAVVITVPAYFDDAQRQGTKDAASLAGLQVLRLLNEPTAAAIAYGLDSAREGIIVVYDLGGGTFDISFLRLRGGVFEVLATGGSAALGGDDFDVLLASLLREQAGMNNDHEPVIWRQLLDAAIHGKIALSDADVTQIEIGGWQGEVTRQQFEELIRPLIRQTVVICRRVLKDAGISIEEVQEVVMVGGSTRVPLVRDYVGRFFQRTPLTSIDPDKVVAIGAAIQADILAGNRPDSNVLLLDVTPLSLGLETMGGLVEKVIPRNTTLPVTRVQEFTTAREGQNAMTIHVLQGERELVADCRSLARFTLRGIPPLPAGAAHIRVAFQLDADGLLSVTAIEKSTGVTTSVHIKPAYGLSEQETARMLQDSMTHAGEDVKARTLAEQKVDAVLMLEGVRAALLQDAALLTEQESTGIALAVEELQQVMQGNDVATIRAAIKLLDEKTRDFAARRMDATISRTLTGRFVDKV